MSDFEEFARSQGLSGDFQRGCNGQYKSDLLHFMEKAFMHQQAKIDELEEMMLRDGALATKAQMERNEWQEVVKSQQKTIENLTNQKEVVNITVDDSNHFEISEKVGRAIKRGARLTGHQIDLRGAND